VTAPDDDRRLAVAARPSAARMLTLT
jgi:hypothetical protein